MFFQVDDPPPLNLPFHFYILLTCLLFWTYIQKHSILSFMVLSVYFILRMVLPFHSCCFFLLCVTDLREKSIKQKKLCVANKNLFLSFFYKMYKKWIAGSHSLYHSCFFFLFKTLFLTNHWCYSNDFFYNR